MVTQTNRPGQPDQPEPGRQKEDGKLERLARHIDPPGREVKNSDLKNPGGMTPEATPVDNRS